MTLAQRVSNRFVEGQARYALAEIGLTRGDNATAAAHLTEAAAAFSELNSPLWQAKTLIMLAELHDQGDVAGASGPAGPDAACRHLAEAADLLSRISSREADQLLARLEQVRAWGASAGGGRLRDQERLDTGTT